MTENGNKSAFPIPFEGLTYGLTKRELFAAMAMQGLLIGAEALDNPGAIEEWAVFAVHCADALLAELGKAARNE